jgi:hypothetical protein
VSANDCKPQVLFEGRNKDNTAFIRNLSLKCDDRADITIIVPDDKNEPVMALLDTERRNKVDAIVLDERRLGKWEETFPLRGLHPDDKLLPTSMEPRCHPPSKPLKNFTCT